MSSTLERWEFESLKIKMCLVDNFISHQAARITAKLTSWGKLRFSPDDLASYLSWLNRQISSTSSEWLTASTSALMIILRVEANREAVIRMGIVEQLLDILKRKCGGFQLQYQIICCFWLISFSCANELLKRGVTVPTCDVLRETEKQKVYLFKQFGTCLVHVICCLIQTWYRLDNCICLDNASMHPETVTISPCQTVPETCRRDCATTMSCPLFVILDMFVPIFKATSF